MSNNIIALALVAGLVGGAAYLGTTVAFEQHIVDSGKIDDKGNKLYFVSV